MSSHPLPATTSEQGGRLHTDQEAAAWNRFCWRRKPPSGHAPKDRPPGPLSVTGDTALSGEAPSGPPGRGPPEPSGPARVLVTGGKGPLNVPMREVPAKPREAPWLSGRDRPLWLWEYGLRKNLPSSQLRPVPGRRKLLPATAAVPPRPVGRSGHAPQLPLQRAASKPCTGRAL